MNKLHSVRIVLPNCKLFVKGWAIGNLMLSISDYNLYSEVGVCIDNKILRELLNTYKIVSINSELEISYRLQRSYKSMSYNPDKPFLTKEEAKVYFKSLAFNSELENLLS